MGDSGPAESLGSLQPPPPLLAAGVRGERAQGVEGSQATSPGVSALTPPSMAQQQTEFGPGEGVGGPEGRIQSQGSGGGGVLTAEFSPGGVGVGGPDSRVSPGEGGGS